MLAAFSNHAGDEVRGLQEFVMKSTRRREGKRIRLIGAMGLLRQICISALKKDGGRGGANHDFETLALETHIAASIAVIFVIAATSHKHPY